MLNAQLLGGLLVAAALVAGPALAQTTTAELPTPAIATATAPPAEPAPQPATPERAQREISDRQLGGHTFEPSHLLLDPFLVTSVGSSTGVLAGQALGPVVDWSQRPPVILGDSKWYNYSGLAQRFDVDVRFFEHYSVRLVAGGGMYTGLGGSSGSGLVVGTTVQAGADLYLKGSWAPAEKVRVAGTLGASNGPAINILVLKGLIDAIGAGELEPSDLAQSTSTTTYRGGATAAWAPTRSLGLQAQAEVLQAVTTGAVHLNQAGFKAAVMAEFDFLPYVSWFPISVNGTVSLTGPFGSKGVDRSSEFGLGVYYSARKEVALGLESVWQEGRLSNELKTKNDLTWVNLRYYW